MRKGRPTAMVPKHGSTLRLRAAAMMPKHGDRLRRGLSIVVLLHVLLLGLPVFVPLAVAAGNPACTLDLAVLTVPANPGVEMEVSGPGAGEPAGRRGQRARTWPGVNEVRFGGLALTFDERSLLWNGAPEPPAGSGVETLIDRRLNLLAGQPTEIRAIVDELHYFVPARDGLFERHFVRRRDLPGLLFRCEIKGLSGDPPGRLVDFDYDLKLVVVEDRETLPGAPELPGRPQLARFRLNRTEEIPAGGWHLVSGHLVSDTGGRQASWLLVLIRISPVEHIP